MSGEITLYEYLSSGSRMAFVYHVAGMDWAATDDPEFAAFINSSDAVAVAYRKQLYGAVNANAATYSADYVKTVCVLDRGFGAQSTTYSKTGGVEVGQWTVTVAGEASGYRFGSLFPYTAFTGACQGLAGLNWYPSVQTLGVKWGVLAESFVPDEALTGYLKWEKSKDFGLKAFIEAGMSGGLVDLFLWAASSAFVCTSSTVTDDGDSWSISVRCGQFNTPAERVVYNPSLRTQISNVPFGIAGNTSRFMSVPFGITEVLSI